MGLMYTRPELEMRRQQSHVFVRATSVIAGNHDTCDFVYNGVSDEVEINAALVYVNGLGGGEVMLQDPATIDDPITFPGNQLILRGLGPEILIDGDGLADNEHAIVMTGRTDCTIKDLSVQTNDGGGLTCHCIFIEDGSDRFQIDNVWIIDSDDDGIHVEGTNIVGGQIINCQVLDTDGNGIITEMDAGNTIYYLHLENCFITSAGIEGVDITDSRFATISGNISASNVGKGFLLWESDFYTFDGNVMYANGDHGITTRTDQSVISNNISGYNTGNHNGIRIDNGSNFVIVSGNMCLSNTENGINIEGDRCIATGNTCLENDDIGLYVSGPNNLIIGNFCYDNSDASVGTDSNIELNYQADFCSVHDNYCLGNNNVEHGIELEAGADYVSIQGNYCALGLGSGIYLTDNDYCTLKNNYCYDNDDYGIEIIAGTSNKVMYNDLIGNDILPFFDGGTDTIMETMKLILWDLVGARVTDGIEIDLAGEWNSWGTQLPLHVQQVLKFEIWGVGLAAPGAGNGMMMEIETEGGAEDEALNNHDSGPQATVSDTVNFAINDIVKWTFTHANALLLNGGDSIKCVCRRNGAVGGDIATDVAVRRIIVHIV